MTPESIKESFEEQLKNTNDQIQKLQSEIARLNEYRVKLIGGLETLNLLEGNEETEEAVEAAVEVDGN